MRFFLTVDGETVALDDDRFGGCAAVRHDEDIEAALVVPPSNVDIMEQQYYFPTREPVVLRT